VSVSFFNTFIPLVAALLIYQCVRGRDQLKLTLIRLGRNWFLFVLFFFICFIIAGDLLATFGFPKLFRNDIQISDYGTIAPTLQNGPSILGSAAATVLILAIWSFIYLSEKLQAQEVQPARWTDYFKFLAKEALPYTSFLLLAAAFPPEDALHPSTQVLWALVGVGYGVISYVFILSIAAGLGYGTIWLSRRWIWLQAIGVFLCRSFHKPKGRQLWLWGSPESARLVFLLAMLLILMTPTFYHKLIPAVSFSILLTWVAFVYFLLSFLKIHLRVPLVLLVIAWIVSANHSQFKYTFPGLEPLYDDGPFPVDRIAPEPAELVQPENILRNLLRHNKKEKPKLVVVATSGGAYRAAFWTAKVIDELEKMSQRGQKLYRLTSNIRLITGASGGMVAAAYFAALRYEAVGGQSVDTIEREMMRDISCSQDTRWCCRKAISSEEDCDEHKCRELIFSDEDSDHYKCRKVISSNKDIVPFDTNFPIERDSLSPVAQQLIRGDLLNILVPGRHDYDRGRILEDQWKTLHKSFKKLSEAERKGSIPSLILSPMIVETGQPLLISNQDLGGLQEYGIGEVVELFELLPEAHPRLKLATAVRMNATFPYVSPAVSLPTMPSRRLVDAGYYDNYGVNLAVAWLQQEAVKNYLLNHTSGVVVVQIRAFAFPNKKDPPSPVDRAFQGISTPLEGVGAAREASMIFRNNQELRHLDWLYCEGFVKTVVFENREDPRAVEMSWYLTDRELVRINEQWLKPHNQESLAALEVIWNGESAK
jgi:hypothetical protein